MIITALGLLTTASIGVAGQTNGQVTTLPSTYEGLTPHELSSNVRSTENITNGTTGTTSTEGEQTSGNISSASPLLSFSEYSNSKYGFEIQYPSDWQIISIANGSLSSSITGTSTDVIVRIRSPPDPQNGTQDLVTISVENISAASPQQANGNLTAYDYAAPII